MLWTRPHYRKTRDNEGLTARLVVENIVPVYYCYHSAPPESRGGRGILIFIGNLNVGFKEVVRSDRSLCPEE